jgi:hypothetical protein
MSNAPRRRKHRFQKSLAATLSLSMRLLALSVFRMESLCRLDTCSVSFPFSSDGKPMKDPSTLQTIRRLIYETGKRERCARPRESRRGRTVMERRRPERTGFSAARVILSLAPLLWGFVFLGVAIWLLGRQAPAAALPCLAFSAGYFWFAWSLYQDPTSVTLRSSSRGQNPSPADLIETRERSGNRRGVRTGRARRVTGWREEPRASGAALDKNARHWLNPRAQRLVRPADHLRIEAPFRDRIFHGRVSTDENAAASLANLGDDPMTFGILTDDELQPGAGATRFHARRGTERTSHLPA